MELIDALRTTGAVREFTPEPVADEVLAHVLDTARFAPSGGNRQGWRVVVVRDGDTRRRLRDIYLAGWYEYLAMSLAGLTPWAPLTDRAAEPEVKALFDALDELVVAAVIALGHPVRQPGRLTRTPVEGFATVDRIGGAPFPG